MKNTEDIIKTHVLWALGGGLIPFPIVDFVAVTAIQLEMTQQLCAHYGISYEKRQGKSLVSALVGTSLASIGASFVKAIPGVGSLLGGVSMSVLSGVSTYALGSVLDVHFSNGGSLDDLSVDDFKNLYKQKVEEGKQKAKEWKKEDEAQKKSGNLTREQLLDELRKLEKLKENSLVSDSEYDRMRQELLNRFVG